MDINFKPMEGPLVVVSLGGDMDMYCASQVKNQVLAHWDARRDAVVLDMAALDYLDSSGIGVVIKLFNEARSRGIDFTLAAIPPQILKVMELTKLIGFLPICETVPDAVGKLYWDRRKAPENQDNRGPIFVNGRHRLFDTRGMKYKDFNIDFDRIRYLSHLITQQAPPEIREYNLLEQQVSELVKNAIRHGNRNDIRKKVKIWFDFTTEQARLIVQDEGAGFMGVENWNEFYRHRMECFSNRDFDQMSNYVSYRTPDSTDDDGGNALFAAVEYWNEGVVYNDTRNAVAVGKSFSTVVRPA